MTKKVHIFSENLVPDNEARSWSYGRHQNLNFDEVEAIKKLLPSKDQVIQIDIVEPQDYEYPQIEN